ncbi:MAG: hypothetical protein HZA95_01080 [Candidatus Vogelbacteria bacterium]|nr:hypothetical protein [Candidatus Vogelbacteria bacterium]
MKVAIVLSSAITSDKDGIRFVTTVEQVFLGSNAKRRAEWFAAEMRDDEGWAGTSLNVVEKEVEEMEEKDEDEEVSTDREDCPGCHECAPEWFD